MGRRVWLVLLLGCLYWQPAANGQDLTPTQLAEDLDQFAEWLPAKHVDLFYSLDRKAFDRQVDSLRKRLADLGRDQFAIELMKITTSTGDAHTTVVVDTQSLHYLPVNFKSLADGIFIRAIKQTHAECLQGRVLSIGNLKADQILERFGTIVPHDNPSGLNLAIDNMLNCVEYLGAMDVDVGGPSVPLRVEVAGVPVSVDLVPMLPRQIKEQTFAIAPNGLDLANRKRQLAHWNDWIAPHQAVYFKYNRCQDSEAMEKLVAGTAGFVSANDVQRFVIDLRDNSGGDSQVIEPLIEFLSGHAELNQPGRLFVITGRGTFSSAVLNAMDLKVKTHALIVGEPSAGRPNHFGEVKSFPLQHSGLRVQYSTRFFRRIPDGDPPSVPLDIPVELDSTNWFGKTDPFLDAIWQFRETPAR